MCLAILRFSIQNEVVYSHPTQIIADEIDFLCVCVLKVICAQCH